jgi:hypothetical protein
MNETAEAAPTITIANRNKSVVRRREYFGLTFDELAVLDDVTCTFAISKDEKLVLKGKFSIDRHAGSYKFDDEVVLTVWGTEPPVWEERAWNKGFFRLEIPVAIGLFETALHRLTEKDKGKRLLTAILPTAILYLTSYCILFPVYFNCFLGGCF